MTTMYVHVLFDERELDYIKTKRKGETKNISSIMENEPNYCRLEISYVRNCHKQDIRTNIKSSSKIYNGVDNNFISTRAKTTIRQTW